MNWQLASFVVLGLALLAGFAWYERERPPARVVAMVAALAALAVAGRLAFAAIPNVKPTTDIVLFAGYALGAAPGFAVGAVTAIVSNIFLSHGPWTVWQMAGWGGVGVAGALVARMLRGREPNRFVLAVICGLAGFAFGAWMDVYQWTLAARQDLASYLVVAGSSLPYNLAHAIGNVAFCLLIGPAFIRALTRYRRRFEVRWRTAAIAASTLVLLLVLAGGAAAATPAERAERYLLRAQNADGGFGAAPGAASSPLYSGWTGLGLAAAGHNAADVRRRGGRSLAAYTRRGLRRIRDIGEIERTALLLSSAGIKPTSVSGRNLIAEILAKRRRDGSISGFVSYTAFGVLALRAAGEPAGGATVRWLMRSQNDDGGFGVARTAASDSDMTGAVLQAFALVGRARSGVAKRAVRYLLRNQDRSGGFGQMAGRSPNAQSTAYAVQGLLAVGAAKGAVTRGLRYLTRLQRRDGSIAYSSTSDQTPVWVTAQALAALKRDPLPIAPVPRKPRKTKAKQASGGAAADTKRADSGDRGAKADSSGGDAGGSRDRGGGGGGGSASADDAGSGGSGGAATASAASDPGVAGAGSTDGAGESTFEPSEGDALADAGEADTPGAVGDTAGTSTPGLKLDEPESGGGPAVWLVIAAVALAVAAAWTVRRLLRRRVRPS